MLIPMYVKFMRWTSYISIWLMRESAIGYQTNFYECTHGGNFNERTDRGVSKSLNSRETI